MKNIVITGATSFISLNVINLLLKKNYHIYAVVRRNTTKKYLLPVSEKITIIEADMDEYKHLNILINEECDYFLSFAWDGTRGKHRDDIVLQKNNYDYSVDSIQAMIISGCKTIVLSGSQAEYGLNESIITEDMECNPVSEYGRMKLKLFNYTKGLCDRKGIRILEPRFFSVYGPMDNKSTLIMSILANMINDKECKTTAGIQMWNYLHVKDASKALVNLLESDCDSGAYNFGSETSKPLREYIEFMHKITNSKSELLFGHIPYPITGMVSIYPDISKLQKCIEWKSSITFETGIREIVRKIKDDY